MTAGKIIYVDMDGVLCNFEAKYTEMFGVTPAQVRQSKDRTIYSKHWHNFVCKRGFEQLDWFTGARELVTYLNSQPHQVCILSSAGGFVYQREILRQKNAWLENRSILWPAVIVPGKQYKAGFANSKSILIDDTLGVVEAFAAAGGDVLHYTPEAIPSAISVLEQWAIK